MVLISLAWEPKPTPTRLCTQEKITWLAILHFYQKLFTLVSGTKQIKYCRTFFFVVAVVFINRSFS